MQLDNGSGIIHWLDRERRVAGAAWPGAIAEGLRNMNQLSNWSKKLAFCKETHFMLQL